jgi:hypothetical protein
VFQVDKFTPPPQLNPSETARLKQQIGQLIGEDVVAEYFRALENRYGVSVNEPALAKLVGTSEEP